MAKVTWPLLLNAKRSGFNSQPEVIEDVYFRTWKAGSIQRFVAHTCKNRTKIDMIWPRVSRDPRQRIGTEVLSRIFVITRSDFWQKLEESHPCVSPCEDWLSTSLVDPSLLPPVPRLYQRRKLMGSRGHRYGTQVTGVTDSPTGIGTYAGRVCSLLPIDCRPRRMDSH